MLSFRYCDLYRVRGEFSFVDDGIRIFKATAIGSLLIVAAAFLYRGGFEFRAFSYARSVFVADFIFVLVSVGALRFFMRAVQTFVRSRQINLIPTLVVGRGPEASLFIREMRERPALGYRVIGVVDTTQPLTRRLTLRRRAGDRHSGISAGSDSRFGRKRSDHRGPGGECRHVV